MVDPQSVLHLIAIARQFEQPRAERISDEALEALGKLVRDLTGYIKMTTTNKADQVRDDLLLQAKQLLGVAGI